MLWAQGQAEGVLAGVRSSVTGSPGGLTGTGTLSHVGMENVHPWLRQGTPDPSERGGAGVGQGDGAGEGSGGAEVRGADHQHSLQRFAK